MSGSADSRRGDRLKGGPKPKDHSGDLRGVDEGLPPLTHHQGEWVTLLAKDPCHLFCHWQVSPEFRHAAKQSGGRDFSLRVYGANADGTLGSQTGEMTFHESQTKSYVPVPRPGGMYRVELGFRNGNDWFPLVRSHAVSTPPAFPWKAPSSNQAHSMATYASALPPQSARHLARARKMLPLGDIRRPEVARRRSISQSSQLAPYRPSTPHTQDRQPTGWKPELRGRPSALPWTAAANSVPRPFRPPSAADYSGHTLSAPHGDSDAVILYLFGTQGIHPTDQQVQEALLQPHTVARARAYALTYILGRYPDSSDHDGRHPVEARNHAPGSHFAWDFIPEATHRLLTGTR